MNIKDKIKAGRLRLGLTEQQFAELVGVSRGSVQQWERGTTAPNRSRQSGVADALGLSVAELMDDNAGSSAHHMSPTPFKVPPQSEWRDIKEMKRLPSSFTIPMPDASMSGSIEKGTLLYFEAGSNAEPGQGVIVQDRHGERHIRRFKKGSGEKFIAEATNRDAFEPLDSERDGLKVVAVLKGVLSGML
jgi:transcriptional regulator with XRE-family HTH domain